MEEKTNLLKIEFPKFWLNAYKNKNHFFNYVLAEAKQYVEKRKLSEEYLKKDNCRKLWERRCEFCFEEITTEINDECYCTGDCYTWICSKCFNEYKAKYKWQVTEVQDIPKSGVVVTEVVISKK